VPTPPLLANWIWVQAARMLPNCKTYLAANTDFYPSGLITGNFDSSTQAATEKFQSAQGIISSGTSETTGYGRVGPQTLIRLNSLIDLIPAI